MLFQNNGLSLDIAYLFSDDPNTIYQRSFEDYVLDANRLTSSWRMASFCWTISICRARLTRYIHL